MTGAFFLVFFGAATIMCNVLCSLVYFSQATKLICSPIV